MTLDDVVMILFGFAGLIAFIAALLLLWASRGGVERGDR
jgi:hypothetical protein